MRSFALPLKSLGRLAVRCIPVLTVLATPVLALAEDEKSQDARLEGYGANVTLPSSASAGAWMLFLAITAVGAGVLFMNANRSHLD